MNITVVRGTDLIPPALRVGGGHGDCVGEFGLTIMLRVNKTVVVVTLVRLSSVHRLSSVKPYVQQVCGGDLGPTIFSSLVNMAVMMVTLLRLSSVYW